MGFFGKILGLLNHFPGTVKSGDWAGYFVNAGYDVAKYPDKKVMVGNDHLHQVLIQKKGDISDPKNTLARYECTEVTWKVLDENVHWALVEMKFPDGKVSTVQLEKTQSNDPTKTSQGYLSLMSVLNKGKRI